MNEIVGGPCSIVTGPDGALWFTLPQGSIGRITTNGIVTNYPLPGSGDSPQGIASGPDGALWFTVSSGKIGRITTDGSITQYLIPTMFSYPQRIVTGSDGALWFTEWSANQIGRITTSGSVTEYPLPAETMQPTGITSGPDGALWYVKSFYGSAVVGRITTDGVITEYNAPAGAGYAEDITTGPDGALWFTLTGQPATKLARITTSGLVTEYIVPMCNSWGITSGPDGGIWFTDSNCGGAVARAPTCGLALRTGLADTTLTLSFDLGTSRPANWTTALFKASSTDELWMKPIPVTASPNGRYSVAIGPGFPNLGYVGVWSGLLNPTGGAFCVEWTIVNTGGGADAQQIRSLLEGRTQSITAQP
jgi:virginiamycin B lyase